MSTQRTNEEKKAKFIQMCRRKNGMQSVTLIYPDGSTRKLSRAHTVDINELL